jgi:hypothetical protein
MLESDRKTCVSAVQRQSMSREAFLDWESRRDQKFEFDGFQPVAMVYQDVAFPPEAISREIER